MLQNIVCRIYSVDVPFKNTEYPSTCGAHDSVVEEEKRRRVVIKNFKTMRLANAETKKNIRRFL